MAPSRTGRHSAQPLLMARDAAGATVECGHRSFKQTQAESGRLPGGSRRCRHWLAENGGPVDVTSRRRQIARGPTLRVGCLQVGPALEEGAVDFRVIAISSCEMESRSTLLI